MKTAHFILFACLLLGSCKSEAPKTDRILIKNGTIYDGTGTTPYVADILIQADTIAMISKPGLLRGSTEIDAKGLAVTPGFINMLSWATESLIADGRSLGDIKQGVTLEVMGEGNSMGPLNDSMRLDEEAIQGVPFNFIFQCAHIGFFI